MATTVLIGGVLARFIAVALLLLLATPSSAQIAQHCASTVKDVCYSVNVPSTPQSSSSDSSSSSDLFFQIRGPSSYQWIALGQGSQMRGANIFVVYSSEKGDNVTLSPRLGKGHIMPEHDDEVGAAQVSLLEGSGVKDGIMTANVRCQNCARWSGGTMNFASSNTAWIWAVKSGDPLNTDATDADIDQHDEKDTFTLDLTKAQGGDGINPFIAASKSNSAPAASGDSSKEGTQGGVSGSTEGGEGGGSGSSASSGGGGGGSGGGMSAERQKRRRVLIAHGVLMSLAFVVFFPIGAIAVRLLKSPRTPWIHSGWQFFAYLLALAGMGLGVWMTTKGMGEINHHHPIIGLTVLSALFIQLLLGHAHHILHKKRGHRTIFSPLHIWWGRTAITLGIINGGLGLRYAGNTTGGEIAYGVFAGLIWVGWMGVAGWKDVQRPREGGKGGRGVSGSPSGEKDLLEMQKQGVKHGSKGGTSRGDSEEVGRNGS